MKGTIGVQRTALILCVLAIMGCSGEATMSTFAASEPQARHEGSWMSPSAKNQDLLYVSDDGDYKVYVYSYPKGVLQGTLDTAYGSPSGMCVDKTGDVYITEFNNNEILEYAHGGQSPIATLHDPGQPLGCSFDRRSGNLAVSNEYGPSGGYGDVEIYINAQGPPQTYSPNPEMISNLHLCAYDDRGNLFFDGTNRYNQFAFAELIKRKNTFNYISLNQSVNAPGGIQWDGSSITLGDEVANPSVIYQLSITGSSATVAGTTTLQGTTRVRSFLIPLLGSNKIQGTRVIAPSLFGTVGFYNYPAGGSPTLTFSQNQPFAAVVSKELTSSLK